LITENGGNERGERDHRPVKGTEKKGERERQRDRERGRERQRETERERERQRFFDFLIFEKHFIYIFSITTFLYK